LVPEEPYEAPHVYYDGPKLEAWIYRFHPTANKTLEDQQVRRLLDWRHGARANEYTVDTILTALGSHLDLLPEEFKVGYGVSRPPSTPEQRADIVKRMRKGDEHIADLAKEAERTISALLKWNRAAPGYKPRERRAAGYKDRVCKTCGKDFRVLDRHLKRKERSGRYCSRTCSQDRTKKERAADTELRRTG
jgi:hypothetical protein